MFFEFFGYFKEKLVKSLDFLITIVISPDFVEQFFNQIPTRVIDTSEVRYDQ